FPPETKTLLLSLAKTTLGLIPTVPFDNVIGGNAKSTTTIRMRLSNSLKQYSRSTNILVACFAWMRLLRSWS
ncbi:hypothetical protein AnigIFM63604_009737, partial [Aspergillus niger]